MNEVSRAFVISPAIMIGRVHVSCVRSSLIYRSGTRSLLVDVWLNFEGAEMKMIRSMCVVFMKN